MLGLGADVDNADGRALTAFGDFGVGEQTWLSAMASVAETQGIIRDNDISFGEISLDHWFRPAGVRIGASYWGNADILDSRDVRASLYFRGDPGSIAVNYERREFEFQFQSDLLRGRAVEFSADGLGLNSRVSVGENVNIYFAGMVYDYSRNLRIQPDINVLAFLSSSRLSMINSLVDDRYSAGVEFEFGLRSIDISAARWQTAVDGATVDSYSIGFLTPLTDRTDVEFRVAFDDSENFGRTTAFSMYLYYFGGT